MPLPPLWGKAAQAIRYNEIFFSGLKPYNTGLKLKCLTKIIQKPGLYQARLGEGSFRPMCPRRMTAEPQNTYFGFKTGTFLRLGGHDWYATTERCQNLRSERARSSSLPVRSSALGIRKSFAEKERGCVVIHDSPSVFINYPRTVNFSCHNILKTFLIIFPPILDRQ